MTRVLAAFTVKIVLVWIAALISSIVAAQLIGMGGDGVGTDGPLTGPQAFLVVNLIHAAILSVIASRSALRGWRLAILVWMTLFFAQSFLLMMEAAYFSDSLQISTALLLEGCLHVLIGGAMIGAAVAMLWRVPAERSTFVPEPKTLPIRLALIAAIYVMCYFTAGYYIAWQVGDVRQYYSFGEGIALAPLLLFQVLRGVMWGFLAYLLVRNMVGSVSSRAVIVGMSFSVLAAAQLLYPNTIMPWEVRFPHLIEVGISNFVFGFAASKILLACRAEAAAVSSTDIVGQAT